MSFKWKAIENGGKDRTLTRKMWLPSVIQRIPLVIFAGFLIVA
jgi:hypothetical protein